MLHVRGRNSGRIFIEKPKGTRPLESPKLRWEDNIKMVLQAMRWKGVDWIDPTQDRDNGGLL
jgi:hypothetical protein